MSPQEMSEKQLRVGIVGLGFMGMVHYLTYQNLPDVKVVAVCDRSPAKLAGDWSSIQGNFGPPGEQMDLAGVATYDSIDNLVADANVDLVDITLPPALHADVACRALAAGKQVFCEKPLALSLSDCDRMIAAAREADRPLLVGQVLPFFPEYAWALGVIQSGDFGNVIGGSFKRVISDPAWLANYWSPEIVGGPMLDLHVHDAHFIRLALGMPTAVTSRGTQRDGLAEHWHSLFEFADSELVAHVEGGVVRQQGRPFLHGFEIQLERATLLFEFAVLELTNGETAAEYLCPPTILREDGKAERVELGDGDPMHAFKSELAHVEKVLRGEANAGPLHAELARDAIALCQMQTDSLRE